MEDATREESAEEGLAARLEPAVDEPQPNEDEEDEEREDHEIGFFEPQPLPTLLLLRQEPLYERGVLLPELADRLDRLRQDRLIGGPTRPGVRREGVDTRAKPVELMSEIEGGDPVDRTRPPRRRTVSQSRAPR